MASSCVHLSLCALLLCGGFAHGVEPEVATSEECAQPLSDDQENDEVPIGTVEFLQVGHKFHMPMPHVAAKKNVNKHRVASPNGLLYVCDTTRLETDNLCFFVSTDAAVSVGPHEVDRTIAADGYRAVVDWQGSALSLSPKPWTDGDNLAASDTLLEGDLAAYSKAFELVAPLRDAMMYGPDTISQDVDRWNTLTKAFVDCHVKEQDEETGALSVENVYSKLVDPNGADIHHFVLRFLEEGAIDLVCLMTSLSMDDRCPKIRIANGVTQTSTCWENAYANIEGIYSTEAITPAPTEAPTPAPTPAAPAKPAKPAKR